MATYRWHDETYQGGANKQNEYNVNSSNVKKIVDTTGAGDLFASGFLFGLIKKLPIEECGTLGSKAAAEIIAYYGARPKISLKNFIS